MPPLSDEEIAEVLAMATASTPCDGYGPVDRETAHGLADKTSASNQLWTSWAGPRDDALITAITGNGPTSEANARFYSCARGAVISLVEEVRGLRERMSRMKMDPMSLFEPEEPDGWPWRLRALIEAALRDSAGVSGVLGAETTATALKYVGPVDENGNARPIHVPYEPHNMDQKARSIADDMAASVRDFIDQQARHMRAISHVEVRLEQNETDRLRGEARYIWLIKANRKTFQSAAPCLRDTSDGGVCMMRKGHDGRCP